MLLDLCWNLDSCLYNKEIFVKYIKEGDPDRGVQNNKLFGAVIRGLRVDVS